MHSPRKERRRGGVLVQACFWIAALIPLCVYVQATQELLSAPSVFDLPRIQAERAVLRVKIAAFLERRDYAEAERYTRTAVALVPHDADAHYNLACAQALQGKVDEALASLESAVAHGFSDVDLLKNDDDLTSLRAHERFQKLVEDAATAEPDAQGGWRYRVTPAPIESGVAWVDEGNTAWDPRLGVFRSFFTFDGSTPVSGPIIKGFGEVGELLASWQAEGRAAGSHGDLYDNHDSDHSNMNYDRFPQLTRIEFAEAPRARELHHGLQVAFLFNGVTIGNSSTAVTGPLWRSQPRLALTQRRTAALLYVQYRQNHLYVYPEHRDHDPGHSGRDGKGHGDVFAVNTPYLIVSQGSSGSDRVFLEAVAATLAAFRPDVKAALASKGVLMPTVQMIFRWCNKPVINPADYLTGKAHPTVFEGSQLDVVKMVKMAQAMALNALPPLVRLRVVEEDHPVPGQDYFDAGQGESLFDTPGAIARVVRTVRYLRRMVVSAEPSRDFNGRPLSYHWSVLRGDAGRIKINPLNEAGSVVELLIPYHERAPVTPGSALESNRVDIGAFAHNGAYSSAPAFVTFFYLDNEKRVYDEHGRIRVVDYDDPEASKNYVDPRIDVRKQWRDEYHYDASGEPAGWTRIRGEAEERFTASGLLISATDAAGRPIEARRVGYVAKPRANRPPLLEQQLTDDVVRLE